MPVPNLIPVIDGLQTDLLTDAVGGHLKVYHFSCFTIKGKNVRFVLADSIPPPGVFIETVVCLGVKSQTWHEIGLAV